MSEDIGLKQQAGNHRLTTIVAVDVCDYSKMSEADELSAIQLIDDIFAICQILVKRFRGRIFKKIADATLVEFQSTQDAIFFAVALREDVTKQTQWCGQPNSVETRIGIHVGDVVDRQDGDILGHGINVAVRLQENAPRNAILASSNVINLLPENIGLSVIQVGKTSLKNIDKPINSFLIEQPKGWRSKFKLKRNPFAKGFVCLILISMMAIYYIQYNADKTDRGQINPEAVSATLYNLRQSPYPISDMFVALNTTNSFEEALVLLNKKYNKKQLSDKDKIDLLHQIGALAMNRNSPEAEKAYRKILGLKKDPEALLQLAMILHKRGDIVQARDFLQRAKLATENTDYSPDRIILGIKTEIALLNGRYGPKGNSVEVGSSEDSQKAEVLLSEIANSEQTHAHHDIRLRARYYALILQFMRQYREVGNSSNEIETAIYFYIIKELKFVIDEQRRYGFLYDLSESYAALSTTQNAVQLYNDSVYTLEQSLENEERLARPSKTISAHANLAYAKVASHSENDDRLSQAEYHIEKVREISVAENRANREYYNLYVLALVENKRGNKKQACSFFDSARQMWPKASMSKGFLSKIDEDLGCNFYESSE